MEDSLLRTYLPKYGDRLAAIRFCDQEKQSKTEVDDSVSRIAANIKANIKAKRSKKLESRSMKRETEHDEKPSRVKAEKRVELGWMHYVFAEKRFVQVRQTMVPGT